MKNKLQFTILALAFLLASTVPVLGQTVIYEDHFDAIEGGPDPVYGNWQDGGSNCSRNPNYFQSADYAVKLRRDEENFMTSIPYDFSPYSEAKIQFSHFGRRLEFGEKLYLEYSINDGVDFTVAEEWEFKESGSDIGDLEWRSESVTISGVTFTATTVFKIRAETESGGNNEIYIDDVTVTGLGTSLSVGDNELSVLSIKNYPNPFKSATNITYNLRESANVSIHIYNIFGQKVSTLVEKESQSVGKNTVSWNASGSAQGIYIATIQINNKTVKSLKLSLID